MKNSAKRSSILMIVILLCTITIIWTNYIFTQKTITDINKSIMENEYNKIWWKENYLILQEIQKREILWYIDTIKKEQPELIEEILEKIDKKDNNTYKILNKNIINDLKKDSSILWNSWAIISIIEFSDLECEFCIKQHNEWINDKILESYNEKVNYIFKNFPLPTHKNSKTEAISAKCVESISWKEKYLEYIDNIFKNTKWGWEWFELSELEILSEKIWTDKEKYNRCINEKHTEGQVEKEFKQWIMLWINSVPSNLIINNVTWEYIIITETINYKKLENIILDILK